MHPAMTEALPCPPDALPTPNDGLDLSQLAGAAEAAQRDPVCWHYLQVLAERTRQQTGPAQALLQKKLHTALAQMLAQSHQPLTPALTRPKASPLKALLQDMAAPSAEHPLGPNSRTQRDNPRVAQFRQQLGKIRVQKQVTQAIAQAPQNAGPINSHMLVLRSLGLMRDLSPDYLNRFMGYVECLWVLDSPEAFRAPSKKASPARASDR